MTRILLGVLLLSLGASAQSTPAVLNPIPAGTTPPPTGLYQGTDRATGQKCQVRLMSVARTNASPIIGIESIWKLWNIKTTMTAQYSAFPGKTFTLVSPADKRLGPTLYSWMRAEVNQGLFGIRGTLTLSQEGGHLFSASYIPNRRQRVDNGPECQNLVRIGNP